MSPLAATTTKNGRTYQDKTTGDVFPSVTTILRAAHSQAWLPQWTAKMAAEYAVDFLDNWRPILETPGGRDAAVDLIKRASERHRDSRSDLGTSIHAVLEAWTKDDKVLPSFSDEAEPYIDAFLQFLIDFEPEFDLAEATVCNRSLGYAGTLDGAVRFPKVRYLPGRHTLDYKSGANLDAEIALQLTAYSDAEEIWLDDLGNKAPMLTVDGGLILHLQPDGYRLYRVPLLEAHREAFRSALTAYWWQENARKTAIGQRVRPPLPDGSAPPTLIEDVAELGRCRNALLAAGLQTLLDLSVLSDKELLAKPGVGPAAVKAIRQAIAADQVQAEVAA